jgi:hypothetical protein
MAKLAPFGQKTAVPLGLRALNWVWGCDNKDVMGLFLLNFARAHANVAKLPQASP